MGNNVFEMVGTTYKSASSELNFHVMAVMQGIIEKADGKDDAYVMCTSTVDEMLVDEDFINAVNQRRVFADICKYEIDGKTCYGINWVACK